MIYQIDWFILRFVSPRFVSFRFADILMLFEEKERAKLLEGAGARRFWVIFWGGRRRRRRKSKRSASANRIEEGCWYHEICLKHLSDGRPGLKQIRKEKKIRDANLNMYITSLSLSRSFVRSLVGWLQSLAKRLGVSVQLGSARFCSLMQRTIKIRAFYFSLFWVCERTRGGKEKEKNRKFLIRNHENSSLAQ